MQSHIINVKEKDWTQEKNQKNAKLLQRWQVTVVEFQKKSGINQIQNYDEQKQ
jgi:hypothetical protein